ncbi:MAG: IclR family transcriptional regulator [Motilibacteraceae bacterium]
MRVTARTNSTGLRRDLELLEVLESDEAWRAGGLGVLRIAELVGRDKSQVSRALSSLAEEGIVERDGASLAYRLGWRLYALAARTQESRLTAVAAPHLRALVAQLHETAHLCVLRGGGVLTLLTESPRHAFRGLGWEGVNVPAPHTSAGRVLVSDMNDESLREWFPEELLAEASARQRIRTHADLAREVAWIRRHGYAKVDEEFEEGLVGVSAPVRDFRGQLVAAINVSAPRGRLGDRLDAAGRLTAAAAVELSVELGWPRPQAPAPRGSQRAAAAGSAAAIPAAQRS